MAHKSNLSAVTGPDFSIGDIRLESTSAGLVLHVPNQDPVTLGEFSELGFSVRFSTDTTPPESPGEGDSFIVPASATGDWLDQDGKLARWMGSAWTFYSPEEGWRVWDEELDRTLAYNGSIWIHEAAANVLASVLANDGPGSGIDADLLDGQEGSSYLRSDIDDATTGILTVASLITPTINSTTNLAISSPGDISFTIDSDSNSSNAEFTWNSNSGTKLMSLDELGNLEVGGTAIVLESRTFSNGPGIAGLGDLSSDRSVSLTFAGLGTGTGATGTATIAFWDGSLRSRTLADLIDDLNIVTSDNPLAVDAGTLDGLDSTAFARSTRTIIAGTGLAGGGDLSTNRSLSLTSAGLTTSTPALGSHNVSFWTDNTTLIKRTWTQIISDLSIATVDGSGSFAATSFSGDVTLENGTDIVLEGTSILGKSGQPWSSSNITTLYLGNGSASAPALAFISDTNSGIYLTGADTIGISTGGGQRVEIADSGVIVRGNLTIEGTTTAIDSNTVNIGDNIIVLNFDETGTPSQDAGIEVERGTSGNVRFIWDETNDRWSTGSQGLATGAITATGNISVSGTVDGRDIAIDGTKLDGIESGATGDQSASEILTALLTVDGAGSGVDADLLDGVEASGFVQTTREITTGAGLSGGGALSSDREFALDYSGLIPTSSVVGSDEIAFADESNSGGIRKRSVSALLSDMGVLTTANEGSGNGIDADLLDGLQGADYALSSLEIITNNGSGIGGGSTLDGDVTLYLDLNTVPLASATAGDLVVFSDASSGNIPKIRAFSDLITDLGLLTTANEGPGNGLDADTVDGIEGALIITTNGGKTSTGIHISSVSAGHRYLATGHTGWRLFGNSSGNMEFSIDGTGGTEVSIHANGVSSSTAEIRVNGNKVFHAGNDGSGSGMDADFLDGLDGSAYARSARNIGVGAGLTGGGNLLADRSIGLTDSGVTSASVQTTDSLTFFKSGAIRKSSASDFISDLSIATLSGNQTFSGNMIITGNLTVSGTTTTVNTTEVNIADNIIILNSDVAGVPSEDSGIEVERGLSTNARIIWDESEDLWKAGISGSEETILTSASTLDADTLGSLQASQFLRSDANDQATGVITISTGTSTDNISIIDSGASKTFHVSAKSGNFYLDPAEASKDSLRFSTLDNSWQIGSGSTWHDVLHKGNDGVGSGIDADTVDGAHLSDLVPVTRTLSTDSGSGLYGGGTLGSNRSLRLGTVGIDSTTAANSGSIIFFTDSATVKQRSISGFLTDNGIWTSANDGSGSGLDADTVDGSHLSDLALAARQIISGQGLSGGGDLSANRTLSLDFGDLSGVAGVESDDSIIFYDTSDDSAKRRAVSSFITDFGILTTANEGSGNGIDADTVDGVHLSGLAQTSRQIISGQGLSGGGDLSANRTLSLDFSSLSTVESVVTSDSIIYYDISNDSPSRRSLTSFISDLQIWTANNDGTGSGLDADTVDGIEGAELVQTTRQVTSSGGLAGGGALSADIDLSLDFESLPLGILDPAADFIAFSDNSNSGSARKRGIRDFISEAGIARRDIAETFASDLTIIGNLTVNGTTTTINTSELSVEDSEITLAKNQTGTPTLNGGVKIERGDEADARFEWDETAKAWKAGVEGNMKVLVSTISGNVTNADTLDGLDSTAFVQTTRQILTGAGLSGGGNLSQNRTLSVSESNISSASAATSDLVMFFDTDDNLLVKKRSWADVFSDLNVLTTSSEGSGNGLDADTVDSLEASQFLRSDADDTTTGSLTIARNQSSFGDQSLVIDSSSNFASIRLDAGTYSAAIGTRVDTWRHAFGDSDLSNVWWGYDGSNLKVQSGGFQVVNGNDIVSIGDDGNILMSRGSSGNPSGYIDFRGATSGSFDQRIQASSDGFDLWDSTENYVSVNNTGIVLNSGTAVTDALLVYNGNTDGNVWRVSDSNDDYGFYRRYTGTKSSNANGLELWSQNQTGTDILIEDMLQDGRKAERTARYYHDKRESFSFDEYTSGTGTSFRASHSAATGAPATNRFLLERTAELLPSPEAGFETLFTAVQTDGTGTLTGSVADPLSGTTSATLEKTGGTYYKRAYNTSVTLAGSTQYTTSVLAKRTSGSRFLLQVWVGDQDNNFEAMFDPVAMISSDVSAGNVNIDSSSIVEVANDWYRCSITYTTSASPSGDLSIRVSTSDSYTPLAVVSFAFPSTRLAVMEEAASFYSDGVTVLPGRIKLGGGDRPVDVSGDLDTVIIGDTDDVDVGLMLYSTGTSALTFTDDGTNKARFHFDHSTDILSVDIGNYGWEYIASQFQSGTAGGPAMRDTGSSSTNPGFIPNRGDTNTGIGWAQADSLSLIAGGTESVRVASSSVTLNTSVTVSGTSNTMNVPRLQGNNTSSSLLLQPDGGEVTFPYTSGARLNFAAGNNDWDFLRVGGDSDNDGFYFKYTGSNTGNDSSLELFTEGESSTDIQVLEIKQNGVSWWHNAMYGLASGSWGLLNETASSTNPTLLPNKSDTNTGIGWAQADSLSLIAGGVGVVSIGSSGSASIKDSAGTWGRLDTKHLDSLAGQTLNLAFYQGTNVIVGSDTNDSVAFLSSFNAPRTTSDASYLGTDSNPFDKLVLSQGSVSAPSLTFGGDSNTGIYSTGADELAITIGGVLAATFSGNDLTIEGTLYANDKSFLIDHPTIPGKKLRHGSLEGPENAVYVRGQVPESGVIELPDYWEHLVDSDSITVEVTPIGKSQKLYVDEGYDNKTVVIKKSSWTDSKIKAFYTVYGERKDVGKMEVVK